MNRALVLPSKITLSLKRQNAVERSMPQYPELYFVPALVIDNSYQPTNISDCLQRYGMRVETSKLYRGRLGQTQIDESFIAAYSLYFD